MLEGQIQQCVSRHNSTTARYVMVFCWGTSTQVWQHVAYTAVCYRRIYLCAKCCVAWSMSSTSECAPKPTPQ